MQHGIGPRGSCSRVERRSDGEVMVAPVLDQPGRCSHARGCAEIGGALARFVGRGSGRDPRRRADDTRDSQRGGSCRRSSGRVSVLTEGRPRGGNACRRRAGPRSDDRPMRRLTPGTHPIGRERVYVNARTRPRPEIDRDGRRAAARAERLCGHRTPDGRAVRLDLQRARVAAGFRVGDTRVGGCRRA